MKARLIAYGIQSLLKMLLLTCRFRIKGEEHLVKASSQGPCMIALWHNRLALIGPALIKLKLPFIFTAFVSNSRDGDILAAYTESYPNGRTIRVPHNAKEAALKSMIYRLRSRREILLITPDGPRGPIYIPKPGIVLAAQEAHATIIPFNWTASSYWEFSSWDRFRLPKPFSTIDATFGLPVTVEEQTPMKDALCQIKTCLC